MAIGSFLCLPSVVAISPISRASEFVRDASFKTAYSSSNALLLKPPVVMKVSLLEFLLGIKGSYIFNYLIKINLRCPP